MLQLLIHRALIFAFILTGFSLASQVAHAGPNRNIHIDDQPFGFTLTHIYWVRTIDDNVERYNQHLTHIFLVKQSIKTGETQKHWLLRRLSWVDPIDDDANGGAGQTLEIYEPPTTEHEGKLKGSPADSTLYRNPYDILRAEKAASISQLSIAPANTSLVHWNFTPELGLIRQDKNIIQKIDETAVRDVRLTFAEIRDQLTSSIWPSLEEMKKFAPDDPRSTIPQSSFAISPDIVCVVENKFLLVALDPVWYFQLSCEDESIINFWKLWVVAR